MIKDVIFKGTSFADFNDWRLEDIKIFDKIVNLIEETRRTPFDGKGKPEPLKHKFAGCWSRRITEKHRLVYIVKEDPIEIISCKYHYT
jgi:toxin YoeB